MPVRYLEIGVQYGYTFENVKAAVRVGVEPYPRFSQTRLPTNVEIFIGGSDEFFAECNSKFDLIFVDGMHEAGQTYRDVVNAFTCLSSGGIVLLDDVFPLDEPSSLPTLESSNLMKKELGIDHTFWYGDVYKVLGVIQQEHPELDLLLVGGNRNHIQALIWKTDEVREVSYQSEADELMSKWAFADFFPQSTFLNSIRLLPEGDAIAAVPIGIKAKRDT